nr:hypothetical protein [Tanacetum cinerariifolium]
MCELACQIFQKKQEEKRIEEEQAVNARYWKILACCDDDDDYDFAITPILSAEETENSLSMGDEHLDTKNELIIAQNKLMEQMTSLTSMCEMACQIIQKKQEEKKIEEEQGENGCDMPACFTTFSNILFDAEYEFDSVDDQSLSNEDFSEKIYSNPLFVEEIISMKIDQHHFNAESDLVESLPNRDSSIIPSSSKIDSLLDEFADELTLLKSIPSGVDKTDCYYENEIRLTKRLLYDNTSPRPPEEFLSKNSNANIESFSPSTIPVEDSDSRMEEIDVTFTPDDPMPPSIEEDDYDSERDILIQIDVTFTPDDPMPPSIEEDDYDSERDILIREELLDNYSFSLPENESFHFDIPSFSRPPAKPQMLSSIIGNVKTLAKGFYPPSLYFLSFSWES